MDELIQSMLENKKWAVVGATNTTTKYGYKIYKKLKKFGYNVFPVNPNYAWVDGDKCYPTLKDLPERVDCVNVVVSSGIASRVLNEVIDLDIENIWFQPGTFTLELVEKSEGAGINTVYLNCVLIELDRKGNS